MAGLFSKRINKKNRWIQRKQTKQKRMLEAIDLDILSKEEIKKYKEMEKINEKIRKQEEKRRRILGKQIERYEIQLKGLQELQEHKELTEQQEVYIRQARTELEDLKKRLAK